MYNDSKTKIKKKLVNKEVKMTMVEFHPQSTQATVDKLINNNSIQVVGITGV